MRRTSKLVFARRGFAHANVTTRVKENVSDVRLWEIARRCEREVLLPSLSHESLCRRANGLDDASGEKATPCTPEDASRAIAKRDCSQRGLGICDLHHCCPRFVRWSRWRYFFWARNLEIFRAEISKDVFTRHNT